MCIINYVYDNFTMEIKMNYIYDSYSDAGTRENNEDSLVVCEGKNGFIAAVADGLGGYRGGEIASALVVESLREQFENDPDPDMARLLENANEYLLQKQAELGLKMKTTAAAVMINNGQTVFANIGDSRIYAFKDSCIVFQSTDHSVAQMCVDAGEITAQQIRTHEDRSVLTRTLGGRHGVRADITVFDEMAYDSLLICSDGFWGCVSEQEMCSTLEQSATPQQWLEKMRKLRNENVNQDNDNNTAVVIFIKEV